MYSEKGSFNIFPAAFSPFELRRIYSKGEASFFFPLGEATHDLGAASLQRLPVYRLSEHYTVCFSI